MVINWLTQESPGLNPDKICEYCVVIHAFKNFATDWEKRERSVVLTHCRVFYELVQQLLFFHSYGKMRVRQDLKIILRCLQMDLSHNVSMQILTISSPWALFKSSFLVFFISSIEKWTSESDFSIVKGNSDGNLLPLSINEHCFAKKGLKIWLFSLKSVINLLFARLVSWRIKNTEAEFCEGNLMATIRL